MKRGSTLFLRATILGMGILVLALSAEVLKMIHKEWVPLYPEIAYLRYPAIIALAATAISFFVASYQALKLLSYIDHNKAFSQVSVKALKNIKYCALIIGCLYAAAMPLVYYIADKDDAPGLIIIAMFFTVAPIVIAVFAAVVQKLLQNAIAIKKENDLTV